MPCHLDTAGAFLPSRVRLVRVALSILEPLS